MPRRQGEGNGGRDQAKKRSSVCSPGRGCGRRGRRCHQTGEGAVPCALLRRDPICGWAIIVRWGSWPRMARGKSRSLGPSWGTAAIEEVASDRRGADLWARARRAGRGKHGVRRRSCVGGSPRVGGRRDAQAEEDGREAAGQGSGSGESGCTSSSSAAPLVVGRPRCTCARSLSRLRRASRFNPQAYPHCVASQEYVTLDCPRRSLVGTGSATIDARPVIPQPLRQSARIFNLSDDLDVNNEPRQRPVSGILFLVSIGSLNFDFQEDRRKLRAELPPEFYGPEYQMLPIRIARFAGELGRLGGDRPFVQRSKACPRAGRWRFKATETYFNGPRLARTRRRPVQKARPRACARMNAWTCYSIALGAMSVSVMAGSASDRVGAATVQLSTNPASRGALEFAADPGERNEVKVTKEGSTFTATDAGAFLQAGSGCRVVTAHMVVCDPPAIDLPGHLRPSRRRRRLAAVAGAAVSAMVWGDAGTDWIEGGARPNFLYGGEGDDVIVGRRI